MIATCCSHKALYFDLFIVYFFQVNTVDSHGRTALFQAAQQGLIPTSRFLLANGAIPSIQSSEGLSAEQVATPPVAKVIKEEVMSSRGNSDIECQLLEGSKNGDLETVKVSMPAGWGREGEW